MDNPSSIISLPGAAPSQSIVSPQSVLHAVRRWWLAAFVPGVLLAIGAGAYVYTTFTPTYRATYWLRIKAQKELSIFPSTDNARFVENQVQHLKSTPLLEPVISDPNVSKVPELASAPDPIKKLSQMLMISPKGGSDIFIVEVDSISPTGAAAVVNAVVKHYLDSFVLDEDVRTKESIELLEELQKKKKGDLEKLRGDIVDREKKVAAKDPVRRATQKLSSDSETLGIQMADSNPIAELQSKLISAHVDQAVVKAEIGALEETLKQQSYEAPALEVTQAVENHEDVLVLRKTIEEFRELIKGYEENSKNLAANVKYQKLKTVEFPDIEKRLADARTRLTEEIRAKMERHYRTKDEQELNAAKNRLSVLDYTIPTLKKELNDLVGSVVDAKGEELELEFLRLEHEQVNEVYNLIGKRIEEFRLEEDALRP